jgi:hypothetical protein
LQRYFPTFTLIQALPPGQHRDANSSGPLQTAINPSANWLYHTARVAPSKTARDKTDFEDRV